MRLSSQLAAHKARHTSKERQPKTKETHHQTTTLAAPPPPHSHDRTPKLLLRPPRTPPSLHHLPLPLHPKVEVRAHHCPTRPKDFFRSPQEHPGAQAGLLEVEAEVDHQNMEVADHRNHQVHQRVAAQAAADQEVGAPQSQAARQDPQRTHQQWWPNGH